MAPTVQPPPPTKNPGVAPTPAASLDDIIYKLYDLIHNIALPKTKTTKTAAITVEALHAACSLAASVCTSLPTTHLENPVLNKVSTQLDAIAAQLAIPIMSSLNGKQSYTTTLTLGIHPLPAASAASVSVPASLDNIPSLCLPLPHPHSHPRPRPCPGPMTHFDLTLTQQSQSSPVFMDLSNDALIIKILGAMKDADCWLEDWPRLPDSEGNTRMVPHTPYIWAVGRH